MIAVLAAAALTCAGALILGQAACRLCGAETWTFLAAPVGLALLMLISVAAIHAPGHTTTVALVLVLLTAAGLVWILRAPSSRPRPSDLLAAAPAAFLALLPFLASGRAGTLGVSFDNDMQTHLRWAEAILSRSVAAVSGLDPTYPLGAHALCAVLARGIGTRVDYAFAGVTMAVPMLTAWTSLLALRRARWPVKTLVATMVALPFLLAGYYAQGSFKELMQALFVLGFALALEDLYSVPREGRLRWVPLALIVGGSLSSYSVGGLPWLVAILALALVAGAAARIVSGGPQPTLIADARRELKPMLIALGVLLLLLIPQIPRIVKFYESNIGTGGGTGIPTSSLGNLAGPIEFWKVFGIWDNPDYRLGALNPLHVGMLAGFGLLAALIGLLWWVRTTGWVVPIATVAATVIWAYSDSNQSPYVAAKALVVAAPLIMLVATRWLAQPGPRESWLSAAGLLRLVVVALFGWAVLGSSVKVLRSAFVGPTSHLSDLRSLQPALRHARTLFLGWDDFLGWELSQTPVNQPYLGYLHFALAPQKAWSPGQPLDFDDIPPEVLDGYSFVVGPRDPAASQPPANMRLIRTSRYYELWERVGPTPHRLSLEEGSEPGAVLNCATPTGRALARHAGTAAVRSPNTEATVPPLGPGARFQVSMKLAPGSWWLSAPYTGPYPIEVTAGALHATVPANLDRPGNVWPIGELVVSGRGSTVVTFKVNAPSLAGSLPTFINTIIATPVKPVRLVPLAQACGRDVDWYVLR